MLTFLISFVDFRNMRRISHVLTIVFSTLLVGCALNNVKPLPTGSSVSDGRAIVVFGVGVEDNLGWTNPGFGVNVDEYDLKNQTAGNCFRTNKMESGIVPSAPGPVKYFAFDVEPGTYVYSAFNSTSLASTQFDDQGNTQAFIVPEGQVIYFGNFILQHQTVVVRRDLDAFKNVRSKSLPNLKGAISIAKTTAVTPPKLYVCSF
jgi:hypothetical protein